jgi:PTS system mannose-specific IIA component
MTGIVIVSHGRVGQEMLRTVEEILGGVENAAAVNIEGHEKVEVMKDAVRKAVSQADTGEGVLILTDMFGGTPSNLGLAFMEPGKVEVITGVNLPMLIKLATYRKGGGTPDEIASFICSYGQRNISVASELLRKKEGGR